MKKYGFLLFSFLLCFALWISVTADEVDYRISSYRGELSLTELNMGEFVEEVTYQFESDYNGQVMTLGKAGNVPETMMVDAKPRVAVEVNGQEKKDIETVSTPIKDGYELKIYNQGKAGDTVKVIVKWQLSNLLFVHQDIVELNWVPISDWQKTLERVEMFVYVPKHVEKSAFYAHRGYLAAEPDVQKEGDVYHVVATDVEKGTPLELHAYWERSLFVNYLKNTEKQGISDFEKVEKRIQRYSYFYRHIFPFVLLILLLLSIPLFIWFKKKVEGRRLSKKARLYEIPQNVEPLLVAKTVYMTTIDEAAPTSYGKTQLSFEDLIQATLLDLIDKGILRSRVENGELYLEVVNLANAKDFELEIIKMAMGQESEVAMKNLFFDFHITKDIYEGKKGNKKDEKAARKAGNTVLSRFRKSLRQITKAVDKEVRKQKLVDIFRPLSKKETLGLYGICAIPILVLLFSAWALMRSSWSHFGLPYLGLIALSTLLLWLFLMLSKKSRTIGVLTDQGRENYSLWYSFSNMLRDIAKLDQAALEEIVLWNRILVYATLLGYAKNVRKAMALRKITLTDEAMNHLLDSRYHRGLYHSVHQLSDYSLTAQTASTFSLPSSSGGSGFFGGGFSGGGGGGGGGAF